MNETPAIQIELTDAAYVRGALEAMLFASGEAVALAKLAAGIGITPDTAAACLEELADEYKNKGVQIIRLEDKYQMRTNPAFYGCIRAMSGAPEKKVLTEVLLETLAIIAYKQPVTKAGIEEIRGLSADHAVNRLMEFGLVREAGRQDGPGRPILLATTDEFLRRFGIASLSDLPKPPETLENSDKTVDESEQTEYFHNISAE